MTATKLLFSLLSTTILITGCCNPIHDLVLNPLEGTQAPSDRRVLRALTMERAVELAKQHRPDLQALDYDVQEWQLREKEAWGGYLPQITFTSKFTQERHEGNLYGNATLRAEQLVFRAAGPHIEARRARHGSRVAQRDREEQEQFLQNEVEKKFIDVWVFQQRWALVNQTAVAGEFAFEKAQQENQQQLLSRSEWLARNEDRATAKLQAHNFSDEANILQKNLTFLLGESASINLLGRAEHERTQFEFKPPINLELKPLEEYFTLSFKHRPELERWRKQMELESESIRLANLAYIPELKIYGLTARYTVNDIIAPPQPGGVRGYFEFGAICNWNIFDGNISRHQAGQARARQVKASLQLERTRQRVKMQVETAYFQVSQSLLTLKAKRFGFERAKNEFTLKKQEFELGLIDKAGLEDARKGWYTMKHEWLSLCGDLAQKHAELRYRCGYGC